MDSAADLHLELVRQAAERRTDAEQHFRKMVSAARSVNLPLSLIAGAAGLSIARIHAILEEEKTQMFGRAQRPAPATTTDDVVVVAARLAYDDYKLHNAYICQEARSFRDVHRIGFYRRGQIEIYFPAIRATEESVLFTHQNASRLRTTGSSIDRELGDLIDRALQDDSAWEREGRSHKVFLLTSPDDVGTLVLPQPIRHNTAGRGSAWTMGQRYIREDALRRKPRTTDEL